MYSPLRGIGGQNLIREEFRIGNMQRNPNMEGNNFISGIEMGMGMGMGRVEMGGIEGMKNVPV